MLRRLMNGLVAVRLGENEQFCRLLLYADGGGACLVGFDGSVGR